RIIDPPTAHTDEWDHLADEAADHRARCLDVARRSTTALLAAVGGGGMSLTHPAQRLARETEFYVIQGQSADGRAATLRAT
ncbi:MAG: acyl-CoA dehydrogenase, partial [Actinomycetota bacterium]